MGVHRNLSPQQHPPDVMEEDKNAPKKPDNTELAFKLYDKDKDGFITKSEMSKVSKRLSKEQVDKAFTKFDADGNGKLDYDEFKNDEQIKYLYYFSLLFQIII